MKILHKNQLAFLILCADLYLTFIIKLNNITLYTLKKKR